jgi:serine/threonine protein kinase/Tfp pilus assembly protein PilF
MASDPKRVQAVFLEAVELPAADRAAVLDRECGADAELRQRVQALLRAHEEPGSFLEQPAVDPPTGPEAAGAALAPASPAEGPGTVIGPYKLLEQIGEGGFGIVFMAEQQQPVRRKVALKVLKPGMDSRQIIARFEDERQALALMDHPNIAHVFDGGETASGRPYFVMELVRGLPITDFCDDNHLLVRQRLELFVSVCQAVQHAHQKGIIHRDLKPSNILVTLHDGTPVVKVIDFGIAKALGQQLTDKTLFTNFAQLMGTPIYMSPEQAQLSGLDMDTRTDIYSLGVLLYELLTSTTPCDKERLRTAAYDEIRRIIREEEPARPSLRVHTLGPASTPMSAKRGSDPARLSQLLRGELDWIVMKALEKDRNRRYETASAFAADVQRYLRDEPVQACPPSTWYRFRKFARRNKAGLAVAGLVLFFIVLLGGGAGWALRDRSAREEEVASDRAARQAKLNQEVEVALLEFNAARELALTLTDNPYHWEATLAAAAFALKRAEGIASQDEAALDPPAAQRLQMLRTALRNDQNDRRFVARFDEIRLEQTRFDTLHSRYKEEIAFAAFKDAFRAHYGIDFGTMPAAQVAGFIQQRPKAIQEYLVAALDLSLIHVPQQEPQARMWLATVLEAADPDPWRKRARTAAAARDWQGVEKLVQEATAARQPRAFLLRLANGLPREGTTQLKLVRQIQHAYPDDFWANLYLALFLHYRAQPQLDEAIRYYTAAIALRPRAPGVYVDLGNALRSKGELDEAIAAFRQAVAIDPRYVAVHVNLGEALEAKGCLDDAIGELRQATSLAKDIWFHYVLGNMLEKKGLRDEALAEFARGLVEDSEALRLEPNDTVRWYHVALLRLRVGDRAGFRKACADMLERFGRSPALQANYFTVWTCALAPDAVADWERPLQLARQACAAGPKNFDNLLNLGAVLYRAGRFEEAAQRLTEAQAAFAETTDPLSSIIYTWLFLAMTEQRLGHGQQAKQFLAKAVKDIEHPSADRPGHGSTRRWWTRRVTLQILRHEAEEVLQKEAGAKDQESGKKPN